MGKLREVLWKTEKDRRPERKQNWEHLITSLNPDAVLEVTLPTINRNVTDARDTIAGRLNELHMICSSSSTIPVI